MADISINVIVGILTMVLGALILIFLMMSNEQTVGKSLRGILLVLAIFLCFGGFFLTLKEFVAV